MWLRVGSSVGGLWCDPGASCGFQNASGDFARLNKSRHGTMCCCCRCLLLLESSPACLMPHPFVVVVHCHTKRLHVQHMCYCGSLLAMGCYVLLMSAVTSSCLTGH